MKKTIYSVIIVLSFSLMSPSKYLFSIEPSSEFHLLVKIYNPQNAIGFQDFDDGFPLGNGDMGVMLTDGPQKNVFNLCKSDIWDSRIEVGPRYAADYKLIRSLVEKQDWAGIKSVWQKQKVYHLGSFLTGGRLTVTLPEEKTISYKERLTLEKACIELSRQGEMLNLTSSSFVCADRNVLVVTYKADKSFSLSIKLDRLPITPPPRYSRSASVGFMDVRITGGPWYVIGIESPEMETITVDTSGVVMKIKSNGKNEIILFCSALSERDNPDPAKEVSRLLSGTASTDVSELTREHETWWLDYFSQSSLSLSRRDLEQSWYFEMYKMGSCSRPGKQAPGLFGLWIGNDSPGWSGDYHLDLNIQQQLWPLYTSNHLEQTESYLQMYKDILPEAKLYTQAYYDYPTGAKLPLCTMPKGGELHVSDGWLAYQYWAGVNAWAAEAFIWYYRCHPEPNFAQRWLPYLEELLMFYEHYLEEQNGKLFIPLTGSPEAAETTPRMWGKNATIDLCLIRQMVRGMIEMYDDLGIRNNHREFCANILEHLVPYPEQNGIWCELEGWNFQESHRHCSVLMPIYPTAEMDLLNKNSPEYQTALTSYRAFINRGEKIWCSFTYPWLSAIAARLGLPDEAERYLNIFEDSFRNVNGMTILFDWKKHEHGIQGKKYHCIEGGNGFAAALNEMMLQSHSGVIQVFHGVPDAWSIRFNNFLAFGGFLVNASKENNKPPSEISIKSLYGKPCKVLNHWKSAKVTISKTGETIESFISTDRLIVIPLNRDETVVLKEM